MFTLLYRSLALLPEYDQREQQMLDAAVSRNKREHITGILHRESDAYYQWLEGPRHNVEAIYSSIEKDSRHNRVSCLQKGDREKRHFSDWSMAYSRSQDDSLFDWAAGANVSLLMPDPDEILKYLQRQSDRLSAANA